MRKGVLLLLVQLFSLSFLYSQQAQKYTSATIYEAIQKLNFLGTVLYIAAHPDDENTRLITYLSNHIKARTAYLSITRGDGGQNLIGSELRELLGVLRTQELLAARNIDGGEQFFTRANDFGYSKHPQETLTLWDKKEVLADVVWAIRKFKPDIIINRFNHRTPGSTHGHHTSSAMLSMDAFDIANTETTYPEQLKYVTPWQPKRLFFNTSWWFYGSRENFKNADKSTMICFDVGTYYPLKGVSNTEIAALSRSQHRCQGFGSIGTRGTEEEYLELLKGDLPRDKSNMFDGINTSWTRVKGGEAIGAILYDIADHFNFKDPSVHIPQLIAAYQRIEKIEDIHWRKLKLREIKAIIAACAGLYLEATTNNATAIPGETLNINIEAINRSTVAIRLKNISITPDKKNNIIGDALHNNIKNQYAIPITIAPEQPYTTPYWLMEKNAVGMYRVDDQKLIGMPQTPRAITATFMIDIDHVTIPFERDVVYKYSEPSMGERYEPFQILPPVSVAVDSDAIVFSTSTPKQIPVNIASLTSNRSGTVSLTSPEGWEVSPKYIDFSIAQKGDKKTVIFTITPPKEENEGVLLPVVRNDGKIYAKKLVEIRYDHIPKQSVLLSSAIKVVRINLQKTGTYIGYIDGAGDKIPESLRQIGYTVIAIAPEEIEAAMLKKFDAIVMGIRAYNVVDVLKFKQKFLLDYVNDGGNLIVQYNTSGRQGPGIENLAPYPLQLSRDRVTDENSEVRLLAKNHAILNFPNKIEVSDFEGWVQERGLYFPDKWAPEFTPILAMNDVGESPKKGSLLVARYGKGYYIYTGLSFFRELPGGVSGAYKLFTNMLSLGKSKIERIDKKPGKG